MPKLFCKCSSFFSSLIPTHTPSLFLQEDFPEHTHHNLVFSLHQSLSWHGDLLLLPRDYHLLSQCMNEQSMNAILTLESLQNAVKSFSRPTVTSNQVYSLSDSNPFSATGKMCVKTGAKAIHVVKCGKNLAELSSSIG